MGCVDRSAPASFADESSTGNGAAFLHGSGCEAPHVTFVCRVCSVATVVPGSTRASRERKDICRGDDRATQTRSRRRRVSRRDTSRCVVAATSQRSPARIRACALSSMLDRSRCRSMRRDGCVDERSRLAQRCAVSRKSVHADPASSPRAECLPVVVESLARGCRGADDRVACAAGERRCRRLTDPLYLLQLQ